MIRLKSKLISITWINPLRTYNKVKVLFRKPGKQYFFYRNRNNTSNYSWIIDIYATDVVYKIKYGYSINYEYGPRIVITLFKYFKFGWFYTPPCNIEDYIYWETILTYLEDPDRNLTKAIDDNRWETVNDGDEITYFDASKALKCVKKK